MYSIWNFPLRAGRLHILSTRPEDSDGWFACTVTNEFLQSTVTGRKHMLSFTGGEWVWFQFSYKMSRLTHILIVLKQKHTCKPNKCKYPDFWYFGI